MNIYKLAPHDTQAFTALIRIFKAVFAVNGPMPEPSYLHGLLSKPDFKVFVVTEEGEVVGGLTIYVLHHYYETRPIAFIYDVGIAEAFQRKGYGKALMTQVRKYSLEAGFAELFVEAEADDADAIEFYRITGPSAEIGVHQFSYQPY